MAARQPAKSGAEARQVDVRHCPRKPPDRVPELSRLGRWQWALARGSATRVHIAAGRPEGFVFPCLRKDAILQESGTDIGDALDITGGLGRRFCDKCGK